MAPNSYNPALYNFTSINAARAHGAAGIPRSRWVDVLIRLSEIARILAGLDRLDAQKQAILAPGSLLALLIELLAAFNWQTLAAGPFESRPKLKSNANDSEAAFMHPLVQ